MHEAIFKDCFLDVGLAFSLRHQRHVLGLHVSGKLRMRVRRYVFRGQLFRTGNAQRARINLFNADTNLAKLFDYGAKVQWLTVFDFEIALRDSCRRDEGSRFDAIGNDRVFSAAQFFDTFDLNPVFAAGFFKSDLL